MDKYYTQTLGTPILSDSGQKIGRIYDVILNPETGKVVGFLASPAGQKVVAPVDVLSWQRHLVVNDGEDILDTEEIHQVQQLLAKNIRIFQNRVVTKSGEYLGRVKDFAMHEKLFTLTKIIVAKSFFGLFSYDQKIIIHKDILEIKKDEIIVKDPLRLTPSKKLAPLKKLSVDIAPSA